MKYMTSLTSSLFHYIFELLLLINATENCHLNTFSVRTFFTNWIIPFPNHSHLVNIKGFRYIHCVKSVRIRDYSGSHFPAFGLNTERYIFPYSVRMRENADQNNPEYGDFLRSANVESDFFHFNASKKRSNCFKAKFAINHSWHGYAKQYLDFLSQLLPGFLRNAICKKLI